MPRTRTALAALAAAGLLALSACGTTEAESSPSSVPGTTAAVVDAGGGTTTSTEATTTTTAFVPTTTAAPRPLATVASAGCPRRAGDLGPTAPLPTTTTSSSSTTSSTTSSSTASPPPPTPSSGSGPSTTAQPATPDPPTALAALQRDPRVAGATLSVSVWIDGYGEVLAVNPDQALLPASNEKLLTAMGASALLDPDERLHTDVVATGPIVDGVVRGDLVLVGGGDATLTRAGPHSLDVLAQQVADAGITAVEGQLLVDESRYDGARSIERWPADWPGSTGPLSALTTDANMYAKDDGYRTYPTVRNGQVLEFALRVRSIPVAGGVAAGHVDGGGVRVASLDSPTINELIALMLHRSDNLVAELLVKEIGHRATGQPGTTAAGLTAIGEVLEPLCGPHTGVAVDGSGLSYGNSRSARDFRRLLQAAEVQPWGPRFIADLSVAGEPGSLGGRLAGPATSGKVKAKTGSLNAARTLSGYVTTAGGRAAVISVLVNGQSLTKAEGAVDDFVTAIASYPG